jgi:hypothetical protein
MLRSGYELIPREEAFQSEKERKGGKEKAKGG